MTKKSEQPTEDQKAKALVDWLDVCGIPLHPTEDEQTKEPLAEYESLLERNITDRRLYSILQYHYKTDGKVHFDHEMIETHTLAKNTPLRVSDTGYLWKRLHILVRLGFVDKIRRNPDKTKSRKNKYQLVNPELLFTDERTERVKKWIQLKG